MTCEDGGPVNLLTNWKAWHTHNSVRLDVVLPPHMTPLSHEEGETTICRDTLLRRLWFNY
jgi:hypothetical protein